MSHISLCMSKPYLEFKWYHHCDMQQPYYSWKFMYYCDVRFNNMTGKLRGVPNKDICHKKLKNSGGKLLFANFVVVYRGPLKVLSTLAGGPPIKYISVRQPSKSQWKLNPMKSFCIHFLIWTKCLTYTDSLFKGGELTEDVVRMGGAYPNLGEGCKLLRKVIEQNSDLQQEESQFQLNKETKKENPN